MNFSTFSRNITNIFCEFFLGALKTQMSTFFIQTTSTIGLQWQKNIYSTVLLDDPATNLDCMNQCLNVQSTVCQFFILQNNNCYMGRTDVTNGTISPTNSTVTVYTLKCKNCQTGKILIQTNSYCFNWSISIIFSFIFCNKIWCGGCKMVNICLHVFTIN